MPVILSTDDEFTNVLAVTEDELKRGTMRVRFGPSGKAGFVVDDQTLKKAIEDAGIPIELFSKVFNGEIVPLIDAILHDRLEQYAQGWWPMPVTHFMTTTPSTTAGDFKLQAEQPDKIRRRGELVQKALVTAELRARYQIKVFSKNLRLKSFTWEVVEKKFEPLVRGPLVRPYVTLDLETIRIDREIEEAFSWFPFFPRESMGRSEHVSFDVDEEDLDELTKSLEAAKKALTLLRTGAKDGQ